MYGFPTGLEVAVFVGRKLDLVSFSANTVSFTFDGDLNVTVESSLWHGEVGQSRRQVRQRIPLRQSRLMQLVGVEVVSARILNGGTLELSFSNGHVLSVFEEEAPYESYKVRIHSNEFIV